MKFETFRRCTCLLISQYQFVLYLAICSVVVPINSQICNTSTNRFPNNHVCDQNIHSYHQDYNLIKNYCGYTLNNEIFNVAKLTNGKNAAEGEAPYMVSVVWGNKHQCGGAIIDNIHVVSAAHCIIQRAAFDLVLVPEDVTIVMGTTLRFKQTRIDNIAGVVVKEVARWAVHPAYIQEEFNQNGPFTGKDIVLLRLSEPIQFSDKIWPICVGSPSSGIGHINDDPIILSGFGSDENRPKPILQISKKLTLLTEEQCDAELRDKSQRVLQDGQICTIPDDIMRGTF